MQQLLFFIFSTFVFTGFAQKNNLPIQEVKTAMQQQETAWNNFNIDGFMAHYWNNDSLMFIGSKGITYGWQQTLANYKKNYATSELMGKLAFTNQSIEIISDSVVYVIGKWEIQRKNSKLGGHYSLLWKKINNTWVITRDHTS